MTVVEEFYEIDDSDMGFVHIRYGGLGDDGWGHRFDLRGELWFERSGLGQFVGTLRSCLTIYAFPKTTWVSGDDNLTISERGPEQEPTIFLTNARPVGAAHGGRHAVIMRKPLAEKLLSDLVERTRE